MAVQLITLLKENKTFFPGFFLVTSFFLICYLLYPHNPPKTEVAGIASSNVQTKSTPTITPTPSAAYDTTFQPSIIPKPSVTVFSSLSSTTVTPQTSNSTSPTDNTSNNTEAPASSTNSDLNKQEVKDQVVPSPTTIPEPTNTPGTNTIVVTPAPTTAPAGNGNGAIVDNSVNTIVNATPTPASPADSGGNSGAGTAIAVGTSGQVNLSQ